MSKRHERAHSDSVADLGRPRVLGPRPLRRGLEPMSRIRLALRFIAVYGFAIALMACAAAISARAMCADTPFPGERLPGGWSPRRPVRTGISPLSATRRPSGIGAVVSPNTGTGAIGSQRAGYASAMRAIQGRLDGCADVAGIRGTLIADLSIAPQGRVRNVTVAAGMGPLQTCLEATIKNAAFPESDRGARVRYPLVFR